MFSIGGALNELQNAAGLSGGPDWGARVGWNDPATWYTPERRANLAKMAAGAPTGVYQRQEIGGTEAQFGQAGGGEKIAAGYNALGAQTGNKPRAPRTGMAALQRQAARNMAGRAGWSAGGFK